MDSKEKIVIIGGPNREDLMTIFKLQHKEYVVEPPFATFQVKMDCDGIGGEPQAVELELAYHPTMLEYADKTGGNFNISGYVSCISSDVGRRVELSQIYAEGFYNVVSRIGVIGIDQKTYQESDFRDQLERQIEKNIRRKKPPKEKTT